MKLLEHIWESKILTNNGPLHQQFELELQEYLGVKHLSLFSNGTLALMTAFQALGITGEAITSPYSFVATTHALWWNNIKPIFIDIEKDYFNIDPDLIEAALTPETTAIVPVHVYGNPCNLVRLQHIADTFGLKLIYDAAHAFGVKVNGESILNYGDLSILSFHATKVFNTIEGGAIISPNENTKKRIDYLKNFGFVDEVSVIEPGINAKMNELQAAYGLLQLRYVNSYISKRKGIANYYRDRLRGLNGISFLEDIKGVDHSYTYFPILVDAYNYGKTRDDVYESLKRQNTFGRRYFYPLISQFSSYIDLPSSSTTNLPRATEVAERVICLPLYSELEIKEVDNICNILHLK